MRYTFAKESYYLECWIGGGNWPTSSTKKINLTPEKFPTCIKI